MSLKEQVRLRATISEAKADMFKKVLVVEDNVDTREVIALLLQMEGFDVITAQDGQDGISAARIERPDFIITDLNMPRLNGIEMIKILRGQPGFEDVPIVALTAYGSEMAHQAVEAGANRSMRKPVAFDLFVNDLKGLFGT